MRPRKFKPNCPGAGLEPLNAEETELAANFNLGPGPCGRAWEYWSMRLDKAEGNWRPVKAAPAKKAAPKRKAVAIRKTVKKAKKSAKRRR